MYIWYVENVRMMWCELNIADITKTRRLCIFCVFPIEIVFQLLTALKFAGVVQHFKRRTICSVSSLMAYAVFIYYTLPI
jgi:hypothetical protein